LLAVALAPRVFVCFELALSFVDIVHDFGYDLIRVSLKSKKWYQRFLIRIPDIIPYCPARGGRAVRTGKGIDRGKGRVFLFSGGSWQCRKYGEDFTCMFTVRFPWFK